MRSSTKSPFSPPAAGGSAITQDETRDRERHLDRTRLTYWADGSIPAAADHRASTQATSGGDGAGTAYRGIPSKRGLVNDPYPGQGRH